MTLHADLYWSFRSPYSYLAVDRYRAMTEDYDLAIDLRPIYPLALRQPDFFEKSHPNWLGYTVRDVIRLADYHGIPLGQPRPDPIVQDIATRRISADQPHIFRLVRLGQAAARRGRSLAFCAEVARLIWGGTENWHEGGHLAAAAVRAGLDLADLDAEAEADSAASTPKSPPTRPPSKPPAIGASPPWSSRASRSSARTASSWRCGG